MISSLVYAALIVPGAIVAYVLYVRPILHALPQLKKFYADADGFWQTVWALCGKSATLAFAAFVQVVSWALQWIDPIASVFGDPDLRQQLTDMLQANPHMLGKVLMVISFITVAARLRSIARSA